MTHILRRWFTADGRRLAQRLHDAQMLRERAELVAFLAALRALRTRLAGAA